MFLLAYSVGSHGQPPSETLSEIILALDVMVSRIGCAQEFRNFSKSNWVVRNSNKTSFNFRSSADIRNKWSVFRLPTSMVNQIKINNNKRKSIGAYLEESTSGISVGKDMGQDMDKELAFEMIVLMMFSKQQKHAFNNSKVMAFLSKLMYQPVKHDMS